MTCAPKVKAPEARLDYGINWGDGYLQMGSPPETIVTSEWYFEPPQGSPPDIQTESGTDTISNDGFETAVTITGGIEGDRYNLVNAVVTSLGREDERRVEIRVART